MNRTEPTTTELRRFTADQAQIAELRCTESQCSITTVAHVLADPTGQAHAWISDEKPKQPERRILEARYKADLATGAFTPKVLEEIRAEILPTAAEVLERRGWAMPDDPEDLANNDRAGLSWEEEEDDDLVEGFHEGLTPQELSEKHGRTIHALALRLTNTHGLLYKRRGEGFFVKDMNNKFWSR